MIILEQILLSHLSLYLHFSWLIWKPFQTKSDQVACIAYVYKDFLAALLCLLYLILLEHDLLFAIFVSSFLFANLIRLHFSKRHFWQETLVSHLSTSTIKNNCEFLRRHLSSMRAAITSVNQYHLWLWIEHHQMAVERGQIIHNVAFFVAERWRQPLAVARARATRLV